MHSVIIALFRMDLKFDLPSPAGHVGELMSRLFRERVVYGSQPLDVIIVQKCRTIANYSESQNGFQLRE